MLIVVGSYNQDLVWRTPRFPKAGETRTGLFSQGPGGKGFNQAMAAHRLSGHALFIAAIGDDALGGLAMQTAEHEGLRCAWQECAGAATGNAATGTTPCSTSIITASCAPHGMQKAQPPTGAGPEPS